MFKIDVTRKLTLALKATMACATFKRSAQVVIGS